MSANANELSRLISLTFDESPEVRKQAAKSLGQIDDPAAIFALMELGYDKDPSVRDASIKVLETRKQSEAEVMSFAEIFSTPEESESKPVNPNAEAASNEAKEKVLRPITRLFEKHWGKEKADAVKSKMMPTIEKIYLKNKSQSIDNTKTSAEVVAESNESGRKVMQEFLTNYLEVISDLEHVGSGPTPQQHVKPIIQELEKEEEEPLPVKSQKLTIVPEEPALKPTTSRGLVDVDEMIDLRNEKGMAELPSTFFRKAYELMMLSGGDESVMKHEMESMIEDAIREIGLAFKLAKRKFKEAKITNLTRIKDGMRNVNTDLLLVKAIELKNSQGEKKLPEKYYRITVQDSGANEGVFYLFDEKSELIRPGMRIKLSAGSAKTYGASGETVLITGKKGNIYIVL